MFRWKNLYLWRQEKPPSVTRAIKHQLGDSWRRCGWVDGNYWALPDSSVPEAWAKAGDMEIWSLDSCRQTNCTLPVRPPPPLEALFSLWPLQPTEPASWWPSTQPPSQGWCLLCCLVSVNLTQTRVAWEERNFSWGDVFHKISRALGHFLINNWCWKMQSTVGGTIPSRVRKQAEGAIKAIK